MSTVEQLPKVDAILASQLEAVKQELLAAVPRETGLLKQALALALEKPGKLFRPKLLLLVMNALGQFQTYPVASITTAAVAEMIHTATLLHDDVIDEADLRRNQPTVRALLDNKTAILSGDYLLAQASVNLAKLDNCELVAIYANTLSALCQGELIQAQYQKQTTMPWADYEKKNYCKTASLFEAAAQSAGVIAQCSVKEIENLKAYGRNLGLAFQVTDDLLDFTSDEKALGKPVLDDLANGILTAPVLFALEHLEAKSTILPLVQTVLDVEDPSLDLRKELLALLEEKGCLLQTRQLAQRYATAAKDSITFLPETDFKQTLLMLAEKAVSRKQ